MFKPTNLERTIFYARQVEERQQAFKQRYIPTQRRTITTTTNYNGRQTTLIRRPQPNKTNRLQEGTRRNEGRKYYRYGKPWSREHKCPPKKIIHGRSTKRGPKGREAKEITEEPEPEQSQGKDGIVEEPKPQGKLDAGETNIFFTAMIRLRKLDTFKTYGFMEKIKVLVMVDPRSTLNFLDKWQAKQLGLYVDRNEKFPISTLG